MRITGMATNLDMDEIIKNSMKPYRIKIDQMTQRKDVVEIKQKLYRDIIKDGREFFEKYLDMGKSDSLLKQSNWSSVSFTSEDESKVSAKASGQAVKGNYEVVIEQLAQKATATFNGDSIKAGDKININGKELTLTGSTNSEIVANLNKEIKDAKVTYSDFVNNGKGGFIIENNKLGPDSNFKVSCVTDSSIIPTIKDGKYLHAEITDERGNKYEIKDSDAEDNNITLDGITFSFNDVTCHFDSAGKIISEEVIKITGKTDTKELKDKIVGFVNDYNKFIEKLNSTVSTKHDRGYTPLTPEQKKDMSENEIKLWNERVEKGQLYRDSDITRIASSMKETMRTFMEDSGLNLEKIGIKPVEDYSGTRNGTFTIDETKLNAALEGNTEEVMKLFTSTPPELTKEEFDKLTLEERLERKNKTGILQKLKDTLNTEVMKSSSSALLKKVGFDGTTNFSNNELTKSMSNYEKKIKDMEKDFAKKEQALYSKYATFEKMMNNLNSQQSNLMSQLGMS